MCTHGHVYAMGTTCVFHVDALCMPCRCHVYDIYVQCAQVCSMGMPSCCFTFTLDRGTAAGHAKYHVQLPCPSPVQCPVQCLIQVPCHMHAMGMTCVFHVNAMCMPKALHVYAYHVNAMCAHGHVYAMVFNVYPMRMQCVSNVYAMCIPPARCTGVFNGYTE